MRQPFLRQSLSVAVTIFLLACASVCLASKRIETQTRADGSKSVREITEYYALSSQMFAHSVVIGIVVVFGGLVALYGVMATLLSPIPCHADQVLRRCGLNPSLQARVRHAKPLRCRANALSGSSPGILGSGSIRFRPSVGPVQ